MSRFVEFAIVFTASALFGFGLVWIILASGAGR